MNWIIGILTIAFLIFWVMMLVDVIKSKKLNKQEKGIWVILFLLTGIAAFAWYFVKK